MATRFYIHPTETPAVSPAFGGWDNTSFAFYRKLVSDKTSLPSSGGFATTSGDEWTSGQTKLTICAVSLPMSSGLVFTGATFDGQFKMQEAGAQDNVVERIRIAIYSEDGGTLRSQLLAIGGYGNESELVAGTTTNNTVADGDATGATYTTVAGDRFVFEIGFTDVSGTTPIALMQYGGNSGSTDLPVDETTTANNAGWIQTSVNVTFGGGAVPPSLYTTASPRRW